MAPILNTRLSALCALLLLATSGLAQDESRPTDSALSSALSSAASELSSAASTVFATSPASTVTASVSLPPQASSVAAEPSSSASVSLPPQASSVAAEPSSSVAALGATTGPPIETSSFPFSSPATLGPEISLLPSNTRGARRMFRQ
ncbi:hypothetical protein C8Q74DRAFT_1222272 [Fomes fomentarius]|nr:hypothetical protein C8Q74DRAFT_1222272 [Fomes fomentarius]